MLTRLALRRTQLPAFIAQRSILAAQARFGSQYHYPEGPLSSLPFNPRKKYFGIKYWSTMVFFFSLPFMIAIWQTKKNKP